MKIKRHYLGAAIAALTVATFAGSAFADDSGGTGGSAVQEETSLAAPTEQSSDAAATEQTDIAPDTNTSDDAGSADTGAATDTTTAADSGGWIAADSPASGTDGEDPTPPAATDSSDPGSNSEGNGSTEEQTSADDTSATCPSQPVTNAHLSIGPTAATATFSIAPGCVGIVVTLASYTEPDPQTLFDSASGTFSAGGPYTLTVNRPTCFVLIDRFFQIDLITGPAPSVLTFAPVVGAAQRIGTPCETAPPPPPPTTTTTTGNTTTTETTTTPTTTTTETTTTTTTTGVVGPTTSTPGNVAGEQTSSGGNNNVLAVAAEAASLPFTGSPLTLVIALGTLLILLGVGLRLAARRSARP